MRVGIAADPDGFALKTFLVTALLESGYEVGDFGGFASEPDDNYPDFVVPLAQAVASREVERGVAICGSGIGATVAANKVMGVRACLIHDTFSAHRGVEDDALNMICLGSWVVGRSLAWELVQTFLAARFRGAEQQLRCLATIEDLEQTKLPRISQPLSIVPPTAPEPTGREKSKGDIQQGFRYHLSW